MTGPGGQRERHVLLCLTVFICGAVVLILEILGSRLLAPFFGSTQYVWSSLIAVTLLALSVGYGVGGRVADRVDPLPALYRILVVAGWLVLIVPWLKKVVLPATTVFGLRGGALVAALVLLAVPLGLLGCVAPLAAKSAVNALTSLGVRVGGLYALSTVGSLAGALAAGFLLIPLMGVTRILLLAALLLFLPALWFWIRAVRTQERRWWRALAAAGAILCLSGMLVRAEYPQKRKGEPWVLLDKTDGLYGEIKVVQFGDRRILLLDGTLQTGIDLSLRLPIFAYAAAVDALICAAHPAAHRALLIGFGGGVMAEQLAKNGLEVESVEIDPAVEIAARRFFTRRQDLPVALEDARTFLGRVAPATYDVIILDAYAGEAPPPHLFTVEAHRLVRRALTRDGIGVANVIAIAQGPESRLIRSVGRTLSEVFPWVVAYAVDGRDVTNVLFVFGERKRKLNHLPAVSTHPQTVEQVRSLLSREVDLTGADAIVLTDEYNPIETMSLMARERMRRHLHELLPTWVILE